MFVSSVSNDAMEYVTPFGRCQIAPFFSEEDIIHEERRKRRRIGTSPAHPRGLITPFVHDTNYNYRNKERELLMTTHSSAPRLPPPLGVGSEARTRTSIDEVMTELQTVVNKIKQLSRSIGGSHGRHINVDVEKKLGALVVALAQQFEHTGHHHCSSKPRSFDVDFEMTDTNKPATVSTAVKRKRSRRIITLKRTYETMEVDLD